MAELHDRKRCKRESSEADHSSPCVQSKVISSFQADLEQSYLPIWKNAGSRRGGLYQHVVDAPKTMSELLQWLDHVLLFELESGFLCPSYTCVSDLVNSAWSVEWTAETLTVFQAVANSSGVMYPPRHVRNSPSAALFSGPSVALRTRVLSRRGSLPSSTLAAPDTNDSENNRSTPLSRSPGTPPPTPYIDLSDSDFKSESGDAASHSSFQSSGCSDSDDELDSRGEFEVDAS